MRRGTILPLLALVASLVVFGCDHLPVKQYWIPQDGMYPTYSANDRVFVENRAYTTAAEVSPGDIVVYRYLDDGTEYRVIWRVIGVPGDKVAVDGTSVSVNGQELSHELSREEAERTIYTESNRDVSYLVAYDREPRQERRVALELIVPAEQFFLMGDNRDNAWDSRFTGLVSFDQILGRIL